jgi:hypothetical protein
MILSTAPEWWYGIIMKLIQLLQKKCEFTTQTDRFRHSLWIIYIIQVKYGFIPQVDEILWIIIRFRGRWVSYFSRVKRIAIHFDRWPCKLVLKWRMICWSYSNWLSWGTQRFSWTSGMSIRSEGVGSLFYWPRYHFVGYAIMWLRAYWKRTGTTKSFISSLGWILIPMKFTQNISVHGFKERAQLFNLRALVWTTSPS